MPQRFTKADVAEAEMIPQRQAKPVNTTQAPTVSQLWKKNNNAFVRTELGVFGAQRLRGATTRSDFDGPV